MPLWVRITFETVPLTANRARRRSTIAYPSRGGAARPRVLAVEDDLRHRARLVRPPMLGAAATNR